MEDGGTDTLPKGEEEVIGKGKPVAGEGAQYSGLTGEEDKSG